MNSCASALRRKGAPHFLRSPQPAARAPATFEAIKSSATEVVFENLRDDFPQRVIYRLASPTQLNASIEGLRAGVNRSIEYPMDRVSCD